MDEYKTFTVKHLHAHKREHCQQSFHRITTYIVTFHNQCEFDHSKSKVITDRGRFISAAIIARIISHARSFPKVSYEYRNPSHPADKMPTPRVGCIVIIVGSTREKRIERFSSYMIVISSSSPRAYLTTISKVYCEGTRRRKDNSSRTFS